METTFDFKKLSADILAKRVRDDLSFAMIAKELKTNRQIIYSMEAMLSVPSCANLAMICGWLNKGPELYFTHKTKK